MRYRNAKSGLGKLGLLSKLNLKDGDRTVLALLLNPNRNSEKHSATSCGRGC